MESGEYTADPCRASSLPFWKTERVTIPAHVTVVREDAFSAQRYSGRDEPYFKMLHDLKTIREPALPEGFQLVPCGISDFAAHINACYQQEGVSAEELAAYRLRPVYRPELWLAAADADGRIAATGIAELDGRIGEGVLEWIQVSPDHRRQGLGAFVVCELLRRMQGQARFVTVSGRLNSKSKPLLLYRSCGFGKPVIWHVVTVQ